MGVNELKQTVNNLKITEGVPSYFGCWQCPKIRNLKSNYPFSIQLKKGFTFNRGTMAFSGVGTIKCTTIL